MLRILFKQVSASQNKERKACVCGAARKAAAKSEPSVSGSDLERRGSGVNELSP